MKKEKLGEVSEGTSKPTSINLEKISEILNKYTSHFANQEVEARGALKALSAVAVEINKVLGQNNDNEEKKEEALSEPEGLRTVSNGKSEASKEK